MKWLLTTVILMTVSSYPSIQVLILLLLSIIYQIMIFVVKPFVLPSNNRLRFVTELFISFYLYFYLLLSDYNQALDSEVVIKYSSWGLLGVLGACACLNILIYLRIAFLQCKKITTRKCHQWRVKKRQRQLELFESTMTIGKPQVNPQPGWLSKIALKIQSMMKKTTETEIKVEKKLVFQS